MKDIIIKNLQVENKHLRKKVNTLENKILTFESEHSSLEQYGRCNNIENTGIPDLEEKVLDILNEKSVNVSPKNIEACHCVGVSKSSSMKTIGRFINGKHAKKALISRKNLRKNSSPICSIFIPENFIVKNNEITFLGRKRERSVHLNNIYIQEMEWCIFQVQKYIVELVLKIYHINHLFNLFPYYDFGEN